MEIKSFFLKVSRRFSLYRRRGLKTVLRSSVDVAALSVLQKVLGFDAWHSRSPTSLRGYRIGVAAMVSSVEPACVVEVGCGLGSVLTRIDAPYRAGYDVDAAVIRAARMVRPRSIKFTSGGFEAITEASIDVLIAINWPHEFSSEQIADWLVPLLGRTRYIVLDRIERSSPLNYRYYHDFSFLSGIADPVRTQAFGEDHRKFVLFKVRE